jgi:hypothetical protein
MSIIDISGAGVVAMITIAELSPVPTKIQGIEQDGGISIDMPEDKDVKLILGIGTGMAAGLKKVMNKVSVVIVFDTPQYYLLQQARNYEQTHGKQVTIALDITMPNGTRNELLDGVISKHIALGIKGGIAESQTSEFVFSSDKCRFGIR